MSTVYVREKPIKRPDNDKHCHVASTPQVKHDLCFLERILCQTRCVLHDHATCYVLFICFTVHAYQSYPLHVD